jgi:hypothetical protein
VKLACSWPAAGGERGAEKLELGCRISGEAWIVDALPASSHRFT